MANVQLPSINTTPSDIDNAGMRELRNVVKSLLNSTIQLNEELTFLLNNLDTRNVNELNAEVIVANSITADKIQAKAITAEKIDVEELSAISADVGKVTSGEIYGNYIATKENAYPRAEMNNTTDLIGAYKSGNNFILIYSPVERLSPVLNFSANNANSYIFYDPDDNRFSVTSNDANVEISSARNVEIYGNQVRFSGWSALISNQTGGSLQQELNNKSNVGTSTGGAGPYNGGIPIGTQLRTADGGVVTWMGLPEHSHIQR